MTDSKFQKRNVIGIAYRLPKSSSTTTAFKSSIVKRKGTKRRKNFPHPPNQLPEKAHVIEQFTDNDGVVSVNDMGSTCQRCLLKFDSKTELVNHENNDDGCEPPCANAESSHEHDWVNIEFGHHEDALTYLQKIYHLDFLFNRVKKVPGLVHFGCKKMRQSCSANIVVRTAKLRVSDDVNLTVFQVVGCVSHNHSIEVLPCNANHEHDIINEVFDSKEQVELKLGELQKIHHYRRRNCVRDGRVHLSCKKKDGDNPGLCKAHIHLLQINDVIDSNPKFWLKGCLAHSHAPSKRHLLCSEPHEHQIIDVSFKSMQEFQSYLEDNELDNHMKKVNDHIGVDGKNRVHRYICSKQTYWATRYKRKKKKPDFFDCSAAMYLNEPLKNAKNPVENVPLHLTGCLEHSHEVCKSKFSVKFRKEIYARMDGLNMTKDQKFRNFRRFRDLVLDMKKKYGEGFLDQFDVDDVHVTKDLISFNSNFTSKYPKAANTALSNQKSLLAVLKSRRELKKKRLLDRLKYVHNLVDQMEVNEENEDYMDKTMKALKMVPGLNEVFAPKKKQDSAEEEMVVAKQRKIADPTRDEPSPSTPNQLKIEADDSKPIFITEESFPYIVTRHEDQAATSYFDPATSSTIIAFR